MFCGNCGNKINTDEKFCPNCGHENISQKNSYAKNIVNYFFAIVNNTKKFILNYKKQVILTSIILVLVIGGVVGFNYFYDFTKINWDNKTGDYNVTITEPRTLTLNVVAYNKEKKEINDIKFKVSGGEIITNGNSVDWILPDKKGTYIITASAPSGKSINKEIKVVDLNNYDNLDGIYEEIDDTTSDNDNDGITNEDEKNYKTNPNLADTDMDGITDYYEINQTKTDPLKNDSDDDGISDGDELDLGLDPLKSDSKSDGIKDGDRELSYTINDEKLGVSLEIIGKGNISSSTIDIINNSTFDKMDGVLDKIYNFYTDGTISSATVKIKYDVNDIKEKGLNEDNLTLYYFNEETKELEEIETTVDKENKTLTVTLKHFSKYVIGDKNVVLTNIESQIMFVIDNSVSMYNMAQMTEAGYDASTGAVGNDVTFKRLSLTNKLVDMFTGNYKFGVAEFSGNYVNLKEFSDNKDGIKKSVNSMKSNWESNANGTNIVTALKSGISEFTTDKNNHYLLLLTDGKNTEGSLSYNKKSIISSAKDKNVKVCVIGLGSEIDTDDLNEIAESTGCDYYNASDSSALDEIYSLVGSDINYNYVDTNGDNKVDGMVMADSGFIVNRDGFSFSNSFYTNKSTQGHCYGMATFAMLYYQRKLPMSLGPAHEKTIFKNFKPSSGYDLNNTYFSDYKNLYNYVPENEYFKSYLLGGLYDKTENNILKIKKEYSDYFKSLGLEITTVDYRYDDSDFNKYEKIILNIDDERFINELPIDSQLINAIWRLFILQVNDAKITSFGDEPDKAFSELNSKLNEGIPVVTVIPGHGINSIRLIQDINDSNKFKIEVYDNNYPGEVRYINVSRSKYCKWQLNWTAWTNEYEYSFNYNNKDISVSLHYPNVN